MSDLWFIFEPDTVQKEFLIKAADKYGLDYEVKEIEHFSYNDDTLLYEEKPVTSFPKCAINRASNGAEAALYPFLVNKGVKMLNSWHTTELCNDKLNTYLALEKVNANQPKTLFLCGNTEYKDIAAELGNTFVGKNRYGRQGQNVFLINNEEEFNEVMADKNKNDYVFQKYIEESKGKDLRTYVIGNEYKGAILRENSNDFRANISLGGKATRYELNKKQADETLRIAEAVGGGMVSVDYLMKDNGEFVVCETNANACIEDFESAGIPLADSIIELYLEMTRAD